MKNQLSRTSLRLLAPALFTALVATAHAATHPMVFISDTQYAWTEKTDSGEPESEADKRSRSRNFIMRQADATRTYREANGGLDKVPLFLNGDVTAFGHGDERDFMYGRPFATYEKNFYWLLGNHDYQNNVNDCANNGCARDMVHDLRGTVERKYPFRFFDDNQQDGGWTRYTGSLAYSMQFGQLLALQLHNEPTYTTRFDSNRSTISITTSLDFLEKELQWARLAGKDVILNMHKGPYTNWKAAAGSADRNRFIELMKANEDIILGIFAGHLHRQSGLRSMVGTIPVYLSGASQYGTFLTAVYDDQTRTLRVSRVTGNDWKGSSTEVGVSTARPTRAAARPDIRDYPRHGWGTWGNIAMCPDGEAISAFVLRSEAPRSSGDNSGVNAVRFRCGKGGTSVTRELSSKEGPWGEWGKWQYCSSFITGLQHRIEPPQGSGDDTAASNLRFKCADGAVLEGDAPGEWGNWAGLHTCPAGTVAAGFWSKVEDPHQGDNSALNRIQIFCRAEPEHARVQAIEDGSAIGPQ